MFDTLIIVSSIVNLFMWTGLLIGMVIKVIEKGRS